MQANFVHLLERAKQAVFTKFVSLTGAFPSHTLFLSMTDGKHRAITVNASAPSLEDCWKALIEKAKQELLSNTLKVEWLRIEWPNIVEVLTWQQLKSQIEATKRNYFRYGIAFDQRFDIAFLEAELNANAILYGGGNAANGVFNAGNFGRYLKLRHGKDKLALSDEDAVFRFSTAGVFLTSNDSTIYRITGHGPNCGRRNIEALQLNDIDQLIAGGSRYLASQTLESGRFIYGWHPCFDHEIKTYNALRHASSLYAMIEAYEVTRDSELGEAIERSLSYLTDKLIKTLDHQGEKMAVLVDAQNEVKLGGNAVCLLALVKYSELHQTSRYNVLLEQLALAICAMQDSQTGQFAHVLQYPKLDVKAGFRTIYYDGEAAFGLLRLYAQTKDPRWLRCVERAFDYFIAADHWKAHDHWLAYAVNELTRYRPERRYYEFGLKNFADYLDFVTERITTFPTLLELMMAAQQMIARLEADSSLRSLLTIIDKKKFYNALETRAHYLTNGHFWPEIAMFFANPARMVGSFFIRHHAFRVRIDDVEHYLSGLIAYREYRLKRPDWKAPWELDGAIVDDHHPKGPVIAWGGDVNLGRRQHYRLSELGVENVLNIPELRKADLRIINLECVVSTLGEQGVNKGEGGPYYYRARPQMLELLTHVGIDVVATANNHSGDYGSQALLQQAEFLREAGISSVGTGENLNAAVSAVIKPVGDLKVAIFSIDATQHRFAATKNTAGSAHLPLNDPQAWIDTLAPRIADARKRAQVVLVAVHWGENLRPEPSSDEIAVGHAIIEAGADGVLGASAHLLQAIEIYKGRPIIHDAGDFLFDAIQGKITKTGLFSLEVSSNGVETIIFTPLIGGFGTTHQLEGPRAREAAQEFAKQCLTAGTQMQVSASGRGIVSLSPEARSTQSITADSDTLKSENLDLPKAMIYQLDKRWSPDVVPDDVRIAPVQIGPLTLLGVRVSPQKFTDRRMLWVETFWRADGQLDEDIRLDIQAVPVKPTRMRAWGRSMDHDPCDWLGPTSAWKPGQIYRDFYGLRPPYLKDWENVDLQVSIGIVSKSYEAAPVALPFNIELAVPNLPTPVLKEPVAASPKSRAYRQQFNDSINDCISGQTWTADQLAAVTGGKWLVAPPPGWFVRSVIRGMIHKKFVDQPTLYVASEFEHLAFHEQYSSTKRSGMDTHSLLVKNAPAFAGAIVSKPVAGVSSDFPLLQVQDPIKALIELGIAARQRYKNDVIAVTGTVGKSTTVSMIREMLGRDLQVLSSYDNYNSRVGAPALLANLSLDHKAAIVEIAQSALWMERGPVTRLIEPTIALVTEIGLSQSDRRVKSLSDVARWKSRIFDGLTGKAVAIIGDHLACFDDILAKANVHAKKIIIFGESERATMRIVDRQLNDETSTIWFRTPEGLEGILEAPLPGNGMITNAMTALCVLYAMGHDVTKMTNSLSDLAVQTGRLQRFSVQVLSTGVATIIDDSWNAEVSSMLNAISVLEKITPVNRGRKIAVLGRIVHLGEMGKPLHESLAEPLLTANPQIVLTHGDEMRFLREKLPSKLLGPHFSTANELAQYLYPILEPDDVVLVKGSRRDSDFGSVCELLRDASKRVQNSNPAPSTLGEIRHLLDPDSGLSQNSDAVEFNAVSFSVETLNDRSVAIVQTEDGPMGLTQAQLRKHKASIVATIGVSPEQPLSDIPHIHDKKWSSTTKALAIMRRDAFKGTCFAVTGSAGKSSVNSMLLSTLRGLHTDKEILGTTGNQNMFMGVMRTLTALKPQHSHLVQEVAVGHATRSAPVLRPNIAIVTNISEAHLEAFNGIEGIADAKSAVLRALEPDGTAVICRDTALYERVRGHAERKGVNIVTYGTHGASDWKLTDFNSSSGEAHYKIGNEQFKLMLIPGARHQAVNVAGTLACLAAGREDWRAAAKILEQWCPPAGRGLPFYVSASLGGKAMIVDDAFNAAPIAMLAAAEALAAEMKASRRVLVLGEMLELGQNSKAIHTRLAHVIAHLPIEQVYAVGEAYGEFWQKLPEAKRGRYLETLEELHKTLKVDIRDGDVWWFKGAHGSGLHHTVQALRSAQVVSGSG